MPSKIEALVRNFVRTGAEALVLVPGEKIFLVREGMKVTVGRETLSDESFGAVSHDLAPGRDPGALVEAGFKSIFRSGTGAPPVEIEYRKWNDSPAIFIRSADEADVVDDVKLQAELAAAAPPAPVPRAVSSETPAVPPAPPPPRIDPRPAVSVILRRPSARLADFRPEKPVDEVLHQMVEEEASDLHLSSASYPMFRVHGDMIAKTDLPRLSPEALERLLEPLLPDKNREEFANRNDTDFAYDLPGVARFRVNVFRDRHGMAAVFRQIPLEIRSAAELGLPPAVVKLASLLKGLVLVTGPTGSGKSTTLAALVDVVNETRSDHIITIEDPIEFVHGDKKCLVNQREVGTHTRSFRDALRAALREDPDVVLVGEMRDLETITIALETAETGHLVFGTLHTSTAPSTVDRVVDSFPAGQQAQIRTMMAESLRAVIAQTLCRRIGGGRIAALEILLSNGAVQNLIREGKTFQLPSVLQTSKGQGMQPLNDALLDLVKRELVEPAEAHRKAVDKPGLLALYRSHGIPAPV